MRGRFNYLAIAVLLTLLDAVVTVCCGTAVWAERSGNILASGLLVLFAAVGATLLANVWIQAHCDLRVISEETVPIPAEIRGQSDVRFG